MQSTTSVGLSRRSEAEQVTEQRCCDGPISGITVECCVEDVVEQRAVLRPPRRPMKRCRNQTELGQRGYTVNSSHIVNITRCRTGRGLSASRDHVRFPGVTHCATPPPCRRWPRWLRHQELPAPPRRRPPRLR